jgi:hypothetical protein
MEEANIYIYIYIEPIGYQSLTSRIIKKGGPIIFSINLILLLPMKIIYVLRLLLLRHQEKNLYVYLLKKYIHVHKKY